MKNKIILALVSGVLAVAAIAAAASFNGNANSAPVETANVNASTIAVDDVVNVDKGGKTCCDH